MNPIRWPSPRPILWPVVALILLAVLGKLSAGTPPIRATLLSAQPGTLVIHVAGRQVTIKGHEVASQKLVRGRLQLQTKAGIAYDIGIANKPTAIEKPHPHETPAAGAAAQVAPLDRERVAELKTILAQANAELEDLKRRHRERVHAFLAQMEQLKGQVKDGNGLAAINKHVHRIRSLAKPVEESLDRLETDARDVESAMRQAQTSPSVEGMRHLLATAERLQRDQSEMHERWEKLTGLLAATYKILNGL